MDLKGEPQTLEQQREQQSELRLYIDHPLKPSFSKLSKPLVFNNLETDFLLVLKKDKVESHSVKECTCRGKNLLETSFCMSHVDE